jgi:hypothetical protein
VLTPISVQIVDQQPDGTQPDPPELETGSQHDDDALLEARIAMVLPEEHSLTVITGRVAPEYIRPIIQLR